MAGISSNALKGVNYPENRKKYNGIELTKDLDLNVYDAQFRNLDPQIGRWNQVDPKTDKMEMWSPYASNYDNPIRFNDFLGDEPEIDGGPGPSFIPVPGAGFLSAMNETAKDVGNAVGNFLGDVGVSLGGIINGMNQSSTLGTYPSVSADQFGFDSRQTALYNSSTTVGALAPSVLPGSKPGASPELAPVNGKPFEVLPYKVAPATPQSQVDAAGTRRKNRIPDTGQPNTVETNAPGTTAKKYGPDGNVQKEFNQGHQGNNVPRNERTDHVHDYKPNPNNPSGRGDRQPGRPPKKHELKKDFGF